MNFFVKSKIRLSKNINFKVESRFLFIFSKKEKVKKKKRKSNITIKLLLKVICSDVLKQSEVVQTGDVFFLNNFLQFFAPIEQHQQFWNFLMKNIKKGAWIISLPTLEDQFAACQVILFFFFFFFIILSYFSKIFVFFKKKIDANFCFRLGKEIQI